MTHDTGHHEDGGAMTRAATRMATRAAPRIERPSQILYDPESIDGAFHDHLVADPTSTADVTMVPGAQVEERHARNGMLPWCHPPRVTWRVGEASGLLAPMGFIAAWNAGLQEIAGQDIHLVLEPGATLELPWLWYHPSGRLQAIRYDQKAERFMRRVLYGAN